MKLTPSSISLFLRQKNKDTPCGCLLFLPQSEGTNPKGSHTAGTEHTTRNRAFAVSASRGDVGLNLYRSGTVLMNLAPSSISLFLRQSLGALYSKAFFLLEYLHAIALATTTYHKRFHKSRDYSGLYGINLIMFCTAFS